MNERAKHLMDKIGDLRSALQREEAALFIIQNACRHTWTEPERKTIVIRPAGMHTDYYGPRPVERWQPAEEMPRWVRHCTECLKSESTSQVEETTTIKREPKFGGDR